MICPKCKQEVPSLTKDHIIPKWLFNPGKLHNLGIRNKKEKWGHLVIENTEMMCGPCNLKKGGMIDYTNQKSRELMQEIVDRIQAKIDENNPLRVADAPVRQTGSLRKMLQVICRCTGETSSGGSSHAEIS